MSTNFRMERFPPEADRRAQGIGEWWKMDKKRPDRCDRGREPLLARKAVCRADKNRTCADAEPLFFSCVGIAISAPRGKCDLRDDDGPSLTDVDFHASADGGHV